MKTITKNALSRRAMIAASGAAFVATTLSQTAIAANKRMKEVRSWEELIGETFVIRGVAHGRRFRMNLILMDVLVFEADDPDRPRNLRQPFALIFDQEMPGFVSAGTFNMSCRRVQFPAICVNEILNTKYSDVPVLQAVFN